MSKYLVFGLAALFLAGCGGKKSYVKKGEIEKTLEQEAITKKYIESIGIGAADMKLENTTQRRATSRNAAVVAAQYEMLSMIKGIDLEGGIRVERAMETDSVLQTKIDAAIKGAEIIKSEWTNDDGCLVTLRLDKKRLQEMMGVKFK
ncbi:MAG: hypothetical protein LHV69_08270 [Elusimicrobia bacterium]|nr:hypothetical protein [Candidatus Obscuribacterium magneticum]